LGFKLFFLGLWTPKSLIRRELENISKQTTAALIELIPKDPVKDGEVDLSKLSVDEEEMIMAQTHVRLVEALEAAFGRVEAVKRGRAVLFEVGKTLGREARGKLGVGDNPEDLEKAAKILYRVLGIDFHLQWQDSANATAIIHHCPLSQQYSALTCQILCATDEGVINGLYPDVTMQFKEYMTSGCKNCKAELHINQKGASS
jgi:predicted ArsR family transcriptional regulator